MDKLTAVAQLANDTEQLGLFLSTGQTPALWAGLSEGDQINLKATAESEINSPMTDQEWKDWVAADDGSAPGIRRKDHALFQAVCRASRGSED